MARENRQILMFADNSPYHKDIQHKLNNLTLKYLPSNNTFVTQLLDGSIIDMMKSEYRSYPMMRILSLMRKDKKLNRGSFTEATTSARCYNMCVQILTKNALPTVDLLKITYQTLKLNKKLFHQQSRKCV
jgi:hypothetical protein